MAEDSFHFNLWCEQHDLNANTLAVLKEKGFESYLSLSVLVVTDIRTDFARKLLQAQILLLETAMKIFHGNTHLVQNNQKVISDRPAGDLALQGTSNAARNKSAAAAILLSLQAASGITKLYIVHAAHFYHSHVHRRAALLMQAAAISLSPLTAAVSLPPPTLL